MLATLVLLLSAPEPAAVRGEKALTQSAYIPAFWPAPAYGNLWKAWGLKEKPKDYAGEVFARLGLPPAPYANADLPMGLRKAPLGILGNGLGIDCMTCHGGRLFDKSIVGLGNNSLDIQSLFDDLNQASGSPTKTPFDFCHARGTNEAGAFSVYLLGFRKDDLSLRDGDFRELGLDAMACEDVPAWWHLKKKRTMYHVGATDARSVRSLMQFMMHPLTPASEFTKHEAAFADIQQYLLGLEAPKYPFPIDAAKAKAGQAVFAEHCAKCHGTYGENPTYPNRIVPLAEIGTDPVRFRAIGPKFGEAYNASWFAKESPAGKPIRATQGYQAPPLDGVWATAPYFHNGSVPTLEGVLDSKLRPKRFTRSFMNRTSDYDLIGVGWKYREVEPAPSDASPAERRQIYDTTQRGRGNAGHTFGDTLTSNERRNLIEYLKTL
jgi:mono/diheme cytochrome c family protein